MPRLAVRQDDKSVNFVAASDKIDTGSDWIGTGDVTVCGWVKARSLGGANTQQIINNGRFIFVTTNVNKLGLYSDGATAATSAASSIALNQWTFVSATRTEAGVVNFRINGSLSGTADQSSGVPAAGTSNVFIGNRNAADRNFDGLISRLAVFNRILTTAEQNAIYYNNVYPSDYATSIIRDWRFENDTATTVYAYNNIAQTGTITGATFSQDTPFKSRDYPGKNLFVSKIGGVGSAGYPGITPTGAALTTSGWIEDERYGLYHNRTSAEVSARYDSTVTRTGAYTLKISNTDTSGINYVDIVKNAAATIPLADSGHLIRIKPNTSYTVNFYYKTQTRKSGTLFSIGIFSGLTRLSNTSYITAVGTLDWTLGTVTFTTPGTADSLNLRFSSASAGNISDAWIDINSLTLTENSFANVQNLAIYSDDLSNAAYVKGTGATALYDAAVVDPWGVAGAYKLVDTAAAAFHYVQHALINNIGAFSFYMKAGNITSAIISSDGNSITSINLTTGVLSSPSVSHTGGGTEAWTSVSVGGGWWKITCVFNNIKQANSISATVFGLGTGSYTGDGTGYIYMKRFHVVAYGTNWTGPTLATTTAYNVGNIRNVAAQVQNLFSYSDPASLAELAIYGNTTVAPYAWANGLNVNAVTFGDNSLLRYAYRQATMKKGTRYVFTVFIKMDDSSTPLVYSDTAPSDLVLIFESNVATAGVVTSLGNGEYKITLNQVTITEPLLRNFGVIKYATNSSKGFKVSGFQLVEANWAVPYTKATTVAVNTGNIRNVAAQVQNLILQSENLSSASWTKTAATISGVNGIIGTAVNTAHSVQQTFAYAKGQVTYTLSASLKAGAQTFGLLGDNNGGHNAWFNLSNGTVGTINLVTPRIKPDPNNAGYYICEITFVTAASSDAARVYAAPSDGVTAYTGDGATVDIYAKQMQLVQANWAGPYTKTTTVAVNTGNIRSIVL